MSESFKIVKCAHGYPIVNLAHLKLDINILDIMNENMRVNNLTKVYLTVIFINQF